MQKFNEYRSGLFVEFVTGAICCIVLESMGMLSFIDIYDLSKKKICLLLNFQQQKIRNFSEVTFFKSDCYIECTIEGHISYQIGIVYVVCLIHSMIKYKFKIPNKIGDDEQLNCMSKLAFGKRH